MLQILMVIAFALLSGVVNAQGLIPVNPTPQSIARDMYFWDLEYRTMEINRKLDDIQFQQLLDKIDSDRAREKQISDREFDAHTKRVMQDISDQAQAMRDRSQATSDSFDRVAAERYRQQVIYCEKLAEEYRKKNRGKAKK